MSHGARPRLSLALAVLAPVALGAIACGSPSPPSAPAAPAPVAVASSGGPRVPGPLLAPLPTGHTATPTRFVIVSDARAPLALETTFGLLESLSVASLDAPLGMLSPDSPDEPQWPRACSCPCAEPCAECERPMDRSEALVPGGRVELAWNGLLRRWRRGPSGSCFDAFAPPRGRYLVRACAGRVVGGEPGPCGSAEVTLPTSEPIEIHLQDRLELARCPLDAGVLDRAARAALSTMEHSGAAPGRIDRCEPRAECYAETDLPYGEDVVRGLRHTRDPSAPRQEPRDCGILVAPRGDRLLVRVLLPLPAGAGGGERFDHELDLEATRLYSVHYE